MQVNRVQNNQYNQNFGAKVFILDNDKLIASGLEKAFTELCKNLGSETDEIFLSVKKGVEKKKKINKDIFDILINKGYCGSTHTTKDGLITEGAKKFHEVRIFSDRMPVVKDREYSLPRNLEKIYVEYILPAFDKDKTQIERMKGDIHQKLTMAEYNA